MSLQVNITIDDKGINKAMLWAATLQNQLPFAASVALNRTAFDVRQALNRQTTQSFTAPTRFTQTAFLYNRSTKTNLAAQVYAQPNRRFFLTQIAGGRRRGKPYERFLEGLGAGALGRRLVPTDRVINAAGNPEKAIFATIQSKLSTTDQGGVFIGTPKGGGRAAGVYRRSRGQLYALFVEASEPTYSPLFPMERVGNQTAARVFPSHLNKVLEDALRSVR
jgi:hypothetical protein